MRRLALCLALPLFLVAVSSWPLLGVSSALSWPPLVLGILLASTLVLRETRGARVLLLALVTSMSFGLVFPILAVNGTSVYGFTEQPGWMLAGVPAATFLVWSAFLLLALALGDHLRWTWATERGTLPGPWVTGVLLGAMEALWDPALLAEGVLWADIPSLGTYPWGFVPGFVVFHVFIGWLFAAFMDRANAAGCERPLHALGAVACMTAGGLALLVPSQLFEAPELGLSPLTAFGADLGMSLVADGLVLLVLLGLLPRLLPRRRAGVLLATNTVPEQPYPGGIYPLDFYASRLSRGQGVWTNECEAPYLGAHILARNLESECVVLEYPTLEEFREELTETRPEVVGIGFTMVSRDKVKAMCQATRELVPAAMIVLGGHGVVCLQEDDSLDAEFEGLVDELCHGEGVAFMRELLGQAVASPLNLSLPYQELYPMGFRFQPFRMAPLVTGFGCNRRCDFCGTSAFFGGKNIPFGTAEEIAAQVKQSLRDEPALASIAILDEDYLEDKERALEVARILKADPEVDFSRVYFSVFSSIDSVAQFTPEELQSLGMSFMWIGAESKFTPLKKCTKHDVRAVLEGVTEAGICVTLSWVMGFDFQTPENLEEDMDWYLDLPAVTAQVTLLGPIPRTKVYQRLQREGRLLVENWEDLNLYHECFRYKHFQPGELEQWVFRVYGEIHKRKGPSMLRMAEAWAAGIRRLRAAGDPSLQPRIDGLVRNAREMFPVALAMERVGYEPGHRKRARAWIEAMAALGFRPRLLDPVAGWVLTWILRGKRWIQDRFGLVARQPRTIRTFYHRGQPIQ